MKTKKFLILTLTIFLSANSFVPGAFADENFVVRMKDKVVNWIKPVKLTEDARSWLLTPGVKSIIYTEMDPRSFLTIESDGTALRFKTCSDGIIPPSCPNLLAPYYSFTPEELLIHTVGFKGSIRVGLEIFAGAVFLGAGSFPGIGGEAASILGGLAFIGTAINPQEKFSQAVIEERMAAGIVKTTEKSLDQGKNPVAVVTEAAGLYSQIEQNFKSFLIAVKNHAGKEEKRRLADEKDEYHRALANGEIKAEPTCAELKAQQDLADQLSNQKKADSEVEIPFINQN
jgi:hypothetical protein